MENNVVKNNIASIRKKKGLSQKQLAEKVGISFWWLCNVERGRHNPSLSLVARIATALGVNKSEIFLD